MIVLDTNILIAVLLDSESSPAIRRMMKMNKPLLVPPLWRSELRSFLSKKVRLRQLSQSMAVRIFDRAVRAFAAFEVEPSSRIVMELIAAHRDISSYDAEFLALAKQHGCALLTADYKSLADKVPESLIVRLSSLHP